LGGGNRAALSPDAINWTSKVLPSRGGWGVSAFGNNKFVITNGSYIATSTDFISWSEIALPVSGSVSNMIYANNTFVILFQDGTIIISQDGTAWNQVSTLSNILAYPSWSNIAYGNNTFIAISKIVGYGGFMNTSAIYSDIAAISSDGISWTQVTLPAAKPWTCITYGNNKFIALDGNYVMPIAAISSNGIDWTYEISADTGFYAQSIAFGQNKFVSVGHPGNISYCRQ
jgi:hypothetical protein